MNSNLSINVNPEELDNNGDSILAQYKEIVEAMQEIQEATKGLSSWESVNKDKYEEKLNNAFPKMQEMAEAIASYGNVAKITSRAIRNTESAISRRIDMSN